jgi:hypothetical protein
VTSATPEVRPDPTPNTVTASFDVVPGPGRISGVVRNPNGVPVFGVIVRAYRPSDGLLSPFVTTTARDGSYAFPSLAPDEYKLRFKPPDPTGLATRWSGDAADRTSATPVVLAGLSENVVLDVELPYLQPPSVVSGTVESPIVGVDGFGVWAYRSTDLFAPTDAVGITSDGSTGGTYSFAALPVGTYKFAFIPPAGSGLPVRWAGGTSRTDATAYQVLGDGAPITVAPVQLDRRRCRGR